MTERFCIQEVDDDKTLKNKIFDNEPVAEVTAEIDRERPGENGYISVYVTIKGEKQIVPRCNFPFAKSNGVPYEKIKELIETYTFSTIRNLGRNNSSNQPRSG